jgi:high-affinity K+ transport system ATPase subunit B
MGRSTALCFSYEHHRSAGCVRTSNVQAAPRVQEEFAVISLLIGILIVVVVGAICFWAIDKFVRDGRLANLLKLLVVLICLASILQRLLPVLGIGGL